MPNIDKINVNGTAYDVTDSTARVNASAAMTNADAAVALAQNAVSYAEEQTISDEGKATARGNIDAAASVDVNELKGATEPFDAASVTSSINTTTIGVHVKAIDEYTLELYGVPTGNRRYCFLNGQNSAKTTSSSFSQTLPAGTYTFAISATGTVQNVTMQGTYTTFGNSGNITIKNGATITFTSPIMIGMLWTTSMNFGTEQAPTLVTMHATKLTAVDRVAREQIATIESSMPLTPNGETDYADEILDRLDTYGICKLGKGTFAISPIVMPEDTTIEGSGDGTILLLNDSKLEYDIGNPITSDAGVGYVKIYNAETDVAIPRGLYTVTVNATTSYTGTDSSRVYFLESTSYDASTAIQYVDIPRDQSNTFQVYLDKPVGSIYVLSGHVVGTGVAITVTAFDAVRENIAINMRRGCTIKGVCIAGASEPITVDGTIGNRHGIGWCNPDNQYGVVTGCYIHDFSGSAILLQDTSTPTDHGLIVSDCNIHENNIGVFIRKNSEFNKVSNSNITHNYYGTLNRGGNNVFSNCGFDSNVVGIQLDADEGTNGGHGSISNCTINHSGGNNGYGIIIKNTGREMITNCNLYYSDILIQNSDGNVINGCGFGNNAVVEIVGGSCSLLVGCMMRGQSNTVTLTNNTKSKIVNCYTRDGYDVTPVTV